MLSDTPSAITHKDAARVQDLVNKNDKRKKQSVTDKLNSMMNVCHLSLFTLWKITFLSAVTSIRERKTHLMTLNKAHQVIEPTSHSQLGGPAFHNTFVCWERVKLNGCFKCF